jgi:hypothetical protein
LNTWLLQVVVVLVVQLAMAGTLAVAVVVVSLLESLTQLLGTTVLLLELVEQGELPHRQTLVQ